MTVNPLGSSQTPPQLPSPAPPPGPVEKLRKASEVLLAPNPSLAAISDAILNLAEILRNNQSDNCWDEACSLLLNAAFHKNKTVRLAAGNKLQSLCRTELSSTPRSTLVDLVGGRVLMHFEPDKICRDDITSEISGFIANIYDDYQKQQNELLQKCNLGKSSGENSLSHYSIPSGLLDLVNQPDEGEETTGTDEGEMTGSETSPEPAPIPSVPPVVPPVIPPVVPPDNPPVAPPDKPPVVPTGTPPVAPPETPPEKPLNPPVPQEEDQAKPDDSTPENPAPEDLDPWILLFRNREFWDSRVEPISQAIEPAEEDGKVVPKSFEFKERLEEFVSSTKPGWRGRLGFKRKLFRDKIIHVGKNGLNYIAEGNIFCKYRGNFDKLRVTLPMPWSTGSGDDRRSPTVVLPTTRKVGEFIGTLHSLADDENSIYYGKTHFHRLYDEEKDKYILLLMKDHQVFLYTDNRSGNEEYISALDPSWNNPGKVDKRKGLSPETDPDRQKSWSNEIWGIFASNLERDNLFDAWVRGEGPFAVGRKPDENAWLQWLGGFIETLMLGDDNVRKGVIVLNPVDFYPGFCAYLERSLMEMENQPEEPMPPPPESTPVESETPVPSSS